MQIIERDLNSINSNKALCDTPPEQARESNTIYLVLASITALNAGFGFI